MPGKTSKTLGTGWVICLVITLICFVAGIALLVVFEKLPSYWVRGPGQESTDSLGVNFNDPTYWWSSLFSMFFFNAFTTALAKKLNMWQWNLVAQGIPDWSWGLWFTVMGQELLNSLLGFVTLFFGILNIYFFVSAAVGKTVGIFVVGRFNIQKNG